jgi:hypothetical protein
MAAEVVLKVLGWGLMNTIFDAQSVIVKHFFANTQHAHTFFSARSNFDIFR